MRAIIRRALYLFVCVFVLTACTPNVTPGDDDTNNTEQPAPDNGDDNGNEGGNEGGEGNEGGNEGGGEEPKPEEPQPEEPKPEEPKPEEPKPALRVSVIGDSISTFDGYIGGNRAYYPHTTVTNVSQTYWYKLIYNYMSNATFDTNIAWSGSFVSRCTDNNYSDKHYYEQDFCARIRRQGMGNPDVILVHGGTNDSGGGASGSSDKGWVKLYKDYSVSGTAIPTESEFKEVFDTAATANTLDAAYELDDTSFVTAYVKMLRIFQLRYPKAKVVMLIGDHVIAACRNSILAIGEHYGKQCGYRVVDFQNISPYKENKVITKVSSSHPDENGFEVMANYIYQQTCDYIEPAIVKESSQLSGVTEREGNWN